MIVCYINGETAYPTLSSDIKVTKENPYVKKGDSYTMDVAFSMAQGDNLKDIRLPATERRVKKQETTV